MKIRKAEKRDLKQIVKLFNKLDYKHIKYRIDFKPIVEIDRYKKILNTAFNDTNYCLLVAVIGKKVIGFSMGKIYEVKDNFVLSDQIIGDISYIAIDDIFKRKGLGRLLINELELRLQKLGANKLEIRVFDFNKEMIPEKFHYQKKFTTYEKFLDRSHYEYTDF